MLLVTWFYIMFGFEFRIVQFSSPLIRNSLKIKDESFHEFKTIFLENYYTNKTEPHINPTTPYREDKFFSEFKNMYVDF